MSPQYFYPCSNEKCLHEEEVWARKINDDTILPCPKCGKPVERQMFSYMWEDSEKGKYRQDKGWNNEDDQYNFNQKKRKELKEKLNNTKK